MRGSTSIKGFTLIELTVALAIFALLSVMAYQGLDTAQSAKRHTDERMLSFKALQMTWVIMQRDFEQIIDRPIRDEFGEPVAALTNNTDSLIEFTKIGERALTGKARGAMKRVAYRIEDETLQRLQWSVLDRGGANTPLQRPLLENIESIHFRYLSDNGQWRDQWPPSQGFSKNDAADPMPKVIEVTLETKDWGEVKRLFMGIQAFSHENP